MSRRTLIILLAGLLIGAAGMALLNRFLQPASIKPIAGSSVAAHESKSEVAPNADAIWAISLVRARPGQRERLLRFLRANWLALDALLLEQGRISGYRLLEADVVTGVINDSKRWDYAVILEYRDRQAMQDFVPAYLALLKARPQVRIDGLVFADLGEVVQQQVARPLGDEDE
ncbi:hypothetical protein [uncultured Nevskia sp.]|uniref:hypothetical protein n=1 Tax=uncultured Nevskia sp. TaxID=228950 RepID=UPI0025D18B87|nr:hypothetical protein [uncultured Nevskia sp.]